MPQGPEYHHRRNPSEEERIPEWAQRERAADLAWIVDNRHVLKPAAKEQYLMHGRGALVIDTTVQPEPDAGHPIWYMTREQLEPLDEPDVKRMVDRYAPQEEMVVVLIKHEGKQSSYRVMFPFEE